MSAPSPNLYTAVKPLLIFSKIFGLHPNKIENGPNTPTVQYNVSNVIGVLWSISLVIFLTAYAACTITIGSIPVATSELIMEVGDMIYMSVSLINSAIIAVTSIITRNKFDNLLQKMSTFDRKIQLAGPFELTETYATARKYVLVAVLAALALITAYLVIDIVLFLEDMTWSSVGAEVVAYVYPLVTMIVMVLQFATMALLIKQKFRWVNIKLRQTEENWRNFNRDNPAESAQKSRSISPFNIVTSERTAQSLETLRRRHYELCGISECLNRLYNFPILTTALNLFISITFTMYFYFISNSKRKGQQPVLYSIYYGLNGVINCTVLLVMVVAASRTRNEAKVTSEVLHTIVDRTDEVETFIMHFSFQLSQYNVEFSACHVFVLDETLLFSVVGAITTYLVIVVQFQYQD